MKSRYLTAAVVLFLVWVPVLICVILRETLSEETLDYIGFPRTHFDFLAMTISGVVLFGMLIWFRRRDTRNQQIDRSSENQNDDNRE